MSRYLDEVAHLLVTYENPPREIDGLDHERCAALHNAILKHAWIRSGRDESAFLEQTAPFIELCELEEPEENFHPSVIEFYRKARSPTITDCLDLFYNIVGLDCALEEHNYCFPEDDQTIRLYSSTINFTKQDGLVYDQGSHSAIIHLDIQNELDPEQPWQSLESILTVWIEMILRQKVVALSDEVGSERFEYYEQGMIKIPGPDRDPLTGVRRLTDNTQPWTIVPWTAQDLEETLNVWAAAMEMIEEKMQLGDAERTDGLLDAATLDAAKIPDGFAREFLTQARRPRFNFIAPGLRVPLREEFVRQPFTGLTPEEDAIPPILLFRNDQTAQTEGIWWFGEFTHKYNHLSIDAPECPCGLYFSLCVRTSGYPQEDGCNIVLPFEFENGFAKKSDGTPVERTCDLLQAGKNPYHEDHPAALRAFLETVRENVESGHWTVDEHGVAGGLDVWKQADTEEHWDKYFQPLGPSRIW
ncbi:hypothetical protein D0869_13674 [Hortaea werneckii]|uniref:Uncharacterized protein n=1 Tax=Hortaea werneckii TaxID=91943 RepID=A0A3M6Y0T9_HORWE|nr:hypothetical protein KC334_g7043 [Hortaea werneckii]KAI7005481.1 hypothetical protein KC355_g8184 [Hortaea werneckii]KAI7203804.1 hypothetical protein KC324_g1071 [Hortaea werneckii]KAI7594016.1 hypothetical protein KC316_g1388 [Hortaea werneckii]KAI7665126.1 hypothetical protein KC318_g7303 [Hortaea werneckii]